MKPEHTHPFTGKTVLVATKHGKADILRSIFAELGMNCIEGRIDSDQFGTFSKEVKREGTVIETLRKKIEMCLSKNRHSSYIVASEGTYAPHPDFAFLPVGIESLLFYDVLKNVETYVEHLDFCPVADEKEFSAEETDDILHFLTKIGFPDTGAIVAPAKSSTLIFKGLHTMEDLFDSIKQIQDLLGESRVVITTDLRANHCPPRQEAIREAGIKLIQSLKEFCPVCATPGFSRKEGAGALECEACGNETKLIRHEIWACKSCAYEEEKVRGDGRTFADPGECDYCNP